MVHGVRSEHLNFGKNVCYASHKLGAGGGGGGSAPLASPLDPRVRSQGCGCGRGIYALFCAVYTACYGAL